jgi:hypothetical protein
MLPVTCRAVAECSNAITGIAKRQNMNRAYDCQRSLADLLKPDVSRLVVCGRRKNVLMKDGNNNGRVECAQAGRVVTYQTPIRREVISGQREARRDPRRTVGRRETKSYMSEAQKHQLQHRARWFPQSLENALGVLVQGIVFALFLASFIVASEPSVMSIDSVQSLQRKKRVPLGVRRMPRR